MKLTENSSVCSKLFLRDLEIDRKIDLIREIIYYTESDRREELFDIENVLYLRRSKKYRLTNVDNLKKRFKVNKTELETKYYDV